MHEIVTGVATLGLDLGDRHSQYVVVDEAGKVAQEGRIETRTRGMQKLMKQVGACRVVMEAGTHSGWVCRVLVAHGYEVLVANPRQLPAIYTSNHKTDRADAELLARLGRLDPKLLKPVRHRQLERQEHLVVLRQRDNLVRARSSLISSVRGTLKQFGIGVGRSSTPAFAKRARPRVPRELKRGVGPTLAMIEQLSRQIRAMDQEIERLCQQRYPITGVLRQIRGVGAITALAFVLCLESPYYFRSNRQVGAYVGLVPRKDQSGDQDRQLGITRAGDALLRRLLVNGAHYILGPHGQDSDIRRLGERIAAHGGPNARKRAVVAMARKLSVVMMSLWRTGEVYEPLHNHPSEAAA